MALEIRGWSFARPWIEAANPKHPCLLDEWHVLDAAYGIVNVPTGIWIDERGFLVRPPETAFARRAPLLDKEIPATVGPRLREALTEAKMDGTEYVSALREWARHGPRSRYALSADEMSTRLGQRADASSKAAAHFELGCELIKRQRSDLAIPHFKAAHELQPTNWTYKRQAWVLVDRTQSPNDVYETGWLEEVRRLGATNYYPPFRP